MTTLAAVMTGKGTGAISTILLFGESACGILQKLFIPVSGKTQKFSVGKIYLGSFGSADSVIDQVTIGYEQQNCFAINCHGNPLIVELIMELLEKNGARLVTTESIMSEILTGQNIYNTIEIEARILQPKIKTLTGSQIVNNQINSGLSLRAKTWLENFPKLQLSDIQNQARKIITDSKIAGLIINGCSAVLAGPANTGKSTLLNCLAGREKAIVTNIKGTTRDWVSATIQIEPLSMEVIDTAGIDDSLAINIDKASQDKTLQLMRQADLILLVLDISEPAPQFSPKLIESLKEKAVITVLNKSDLPQQLIIEELPRFLQNPVKISAKFATKIDQLISRIHQTLKTDNFKTDSAVYFTDRQKNLLRQLINDKLKQQTESIITELLRSKV